MEKNSGIVEVRGGGTSQLNTDIDVNLKTRLDNFIVRVNSGRRGMDKITRRLVVEDALNQYLGKMEEG